MQIPVYGDESSDVRELQKTLNSNGSNLVEDGIFGPNTRNAVSAFQKSFGLRGSGIIGPKTMKLLGLKVTSEEEEFEPYQGKITREVIADEIVKIVQRDVDNRLRESGGKNRGKRIDEFNRRAKSYMGAPYCASGLWCAIDDACKRLGLVNPAKPTASSQDFRRPSYVAPRYMRHDLGKKGDFGVLQHKTKHWLGHLTVLRADQEEHPFFLTLEYNTDGSGTRDGDGAYGMKRSTTDGSRYNAYKKYICFTDIPQWILDANAAKLKNLS